MNKISCFQISHGQWELFSLNIYHHFQFTFRERFSPPPSLQDNVSRVLQIEIPYKMVLTRGNFNLSFISKHAVFDQYNIAQLVYAQISLCVYFHPI